MYTIALVSQKGGSGKTTLAIHLSAEALVRGRKALLIDLDPQASAAMWADRRGNLGPDVFSEHPARLQAALEAAQTKGYEVVIIDTAPHADQAALRAARAADLVLVPCRPAVFDLEAIRATLEVCELAKRPARVVLNACPIRSKLVGEARGQLVARGSIVSDVVVRQRVDFHHCLIRGQVAGEYNPGGLAAEEIIQLCEVVGL